MTAGTDDTDLDMDYLLRCLWAVPLRPLGWEGEDRNLAAFNSCDELTSWYGRPPGNDGEPYRDRGFYCRELAMLSRVVRPRVVVEFGTSLGIGTCLLRWLNPTARLVTVDVNTKTFLPGDLRVPMGYVARHQGIECEYVTMPSWDYIHYGTDLCFIDADHRYEAVVLDSMRAWNNRSVGRPWAIAWHDHNSRHPGVVTAVTEFCARYELELRQRPDSDTVWVWGGF